MITISRVNKQSIFRDYISLDRFFLAVVIRQPLLSRLILFFFCWISRYDRKPEQSTEKMFFKPFKVHEIECTHSTPYLEKLLAQKTICICSVCIFIQFLLLPNTRNFFFSFARVVFFRILH
jgi:hypothetical protein